jgi:hypothetical protein
MERSGGRGRAGGGREGDVTGAEAAPKRERERSRSEREREREQVETREGFEGGYGAMDGWGEFHFFVCATLSLTFFPSLSLASPFSSSLYALLSYPSLLFSLHYFLCHPHTPTQPHTPARPPPHRRRHLVALSVFLLMRSSSGTLWVDDLSVTPPRPPHPSLSHPLRTLLLSASPPAGSASERDPHADAEGLDTSTNAEGLGDVDATLAQQHIRQEERISGCSCSKQVQKYKY